MNNLSMETRKPYWHPWHYGGPIWWMTDKGYAARNVAIDMVKPENERPERHLRFQPVRGTLPAAYEKARTAYDKAWAAYYEAGAAYDEARTTHMPAIMALHAAECGCCWTPEQPNIFEDGRL